MNCFKRALCYICRKRMRSFLMFLVLFASCGMILGTYTIRTFTQSILTNLARDSESKIILEKQGENNYFTNEDIENIAENNNVNRINRLCDKQLVVDNLIPVEDEDGSGMFSVHWQDRLQYDSPFEEKVYRIFEGNYPENDGEILLNKFLAEKNGLSIGDEVMNGYVVTGLFVSGTERQQTENVATANRIENQIFVRDSSYIEHQGEKIYKISCYMNRPEEMEQTTLELQEKLGDGVSISFDNHTYLKMKMSIGETGRISLLIMFLTILTGGFIAGLLLSMWMRGRKTEIAVFRSMGIERSSIITQMVMESVGIYLAALFVAGILTYYCLPEIITSMGFLPDIVENKSVGVREFMVVGIAGTFLISVLTLIAMLQYLIKHPKEILSELEG